MILLNFSGLRQDQFPNFGLGTVSRVTFFEDLSKIRACISISCQKFATQLFLIRNQIHFDDSGKQMLDLLRKRSDNNFSEKPVFGNQ